MAKNNKNNQKPAPKKESQKKNPPVETVEVEVVNENQETAPPATSMSQFTANNAVGSTNSQLDANHRVQLLDLADRVFNRPGAEKVFTLDLRENVNAIVAAGIVSALADEAAFGNSTFSAVLKSSMYPQLVVTAKDMGIKLPEMKALAVKDDGTVEVKSNDVKVSKEAKEQMKKEKEVAAAGDAGDIELDPEKVAELGEEALVNALKYLFITSFQRGKVGVKATVEKTVDFMKAYRNALAKKAENSEEAIANYNSRTMYEWLADISKYVEPTMISKGIGMGLVALVDIESAPLSAFLTLREALCDKETKKPTWSDQEIADATRFFIEFICKSEIAKERNAIENLDSKQKDYKNIVAKHEEVIANYEKRMSNVTGFSFDICEKMCTEEGNKIAYILKASNRIKEQYYPECDKAVPNSRYIGLDENLRQRSGIILNLFRAPGNYHQNYSESNLVNIETMSIEDWQKMIAEQKKQATAEKKAESKNA